MEKKCAKLLTCSGPPAAVEVLLAPAARLLGDD
jgi:hypothetical protein